MSYDNFWLDSPKILYNKYRLTDFIPSKGQSLNEKLNSITRFCIYLSIILIILKENINYLFISLFGFFITFFIYMNYESPNIKEGMTNTMPTKDNPFMNILVNEYTDNPTRPPAANIEDPYVKDEIEKNFNHNLYKDVNDIWNVQNSQNIYYTMPNTTIPNDRESFMKWCYDDSKVCKDGDLEMCGKYDNNRHGKI